MNIQNAIDFFQLSDEELQTQKSMICDYDAYENKCTTVGNKLIQHFQIHEIFKCRYKKKPTFVELFDDKELYDKMVEGADNKPGHPQFISSLYNTYKFWGCPIAIFKATQSKHVYKLFNATHVFDPTSGWGGRMIGACDIKYTGFDTNTDLKQGYDKLINLFEKKNDWTMNYRAATTEDYKNIDYDCVLTSPPYFNTEIYNHFEPYKTEDVYYKDFLIPMINNSLNNIKRNGKVCINVSPEIYEKLITKYKYTPCDSTIELKEAGNKKIKHQIYIWNSNQEVPVPVPIQTTKNPMIHEILLKLRDIIDILLKYY